jgi:hypothetical protein
MSRNAESGVVVAADDEDVTVAAAVIVITTTKSCGQNISLHETSAVCRRCQQIG